MTTNPKPTLDRDDVELLNLHAKNVSRLHYEDGIDYDLWRFYPGRDGRPGEFSDGHSHPMEAPSSGPHAGWELEVDVVSIPVARVVELLALLDRITRDLDKVVSPKKGADRRDAAFAITYAARKARQCLNGNQGAR